MDSPSVVPALIEGDRFSVISDNDHTGVLWVVSILCFIYTIMVFFLRLEARRKNFGLDDGLAIVGSVFASIQYILIFIATRHGLGKSYDLTSAADAEIIGKLMHATQVFLLLALGLAKCSVISLCRRLFSAHRRSHRIVCDIAMGLCILWSIASILTIAVTCSPLQILGYKTDFCHNFVTRWMAVGILDSITEVAIVGMAFDGLLPLQMSLSRKFQAMATFVLRLVIVALAAQHIRTLKQAVVDPNVGVAMAKPIVYLQVELLYALLSASIPALNRWLRNFDTSMGSAWMQTSQTYSINNSKSEGVSRHPSQAYQLESMERAGNQEKRASRASMMSRNVPKRASAVMKNGNFVPAGPKYTVSTEAYTPPSQGSENQDRPASTGMNSEEMIIRKDVHWNVQYEHEEPIHRNSR